MRRGAQALGLRLWLTIALGAIVGIPTLTTWGLDRAIGLRQEQADQLRVAEVRQIIGTAAAEWCNSAWQRHAGAAFATQGVEVRLVDTEGRELYATNGARQILNSYTAWQAPRVSLAFEKIVIAEMLPPLTVRTTSAPKSTAPLSQALATASLWFTRPPPGVPPAWVAQVSGVIALLLTLAAVAWFLGRWVVRPLAAMSQAVSRIAGGDLAIDPPSSRAREVREIALALTALSAALGQALDRQTALEEERRLFISAIAHDLRTPLFMLRGYLKGLETGVAAKPEKIAQYVRACGTRADALERLIADLFTYTRLEYLDQAPRRERLELGVLLGEAVAEIQPMAATKGIIISLDSPSVACFLTGDRALLGRAVQNLLENAVRHTPDGGGVRVRWDQADGRYVFCVQDTGPGIAPPDLPHLFTPLYRAEPSRNRRTGGAGLGLTIALRILRAHGGDLTAANADTGGALFTGTLPQER